MLVGSVIFLITTKLMPYGMFKNTLSFIILQIIWITLLTLIFCKMFRMYNKEPEYAFLRNMLGVRPPLTIHDLVHSTTDYDLMFLQITLCISRGTVPLIYLTISLVIFPVCKTFNQIVHAFLSKISIKWLALYLEKAKVIHMTLTIGLVIISSECMSILRIFNLYFY